jgi:hypothetical protein
MNTAPKIGDRIWVKVHVQNESIPRQHRRLRKLRPGYHYFTEDPESVVVTPQILRWLNNGSLVRVDPPAIVRTGDQSTAMVDVPPADTTLAKK